MSETTAALGDVLKRGAAMSAIGLILSQGASVVQTLVLGRILGPDEIGVFMAGSVLIGFLVLFARGALSQALIHRKTDLEDAANTVLVVTLATGSMGSLALLAASPLIGSIFHDPRVGVIAAATSGLMLLHVVASVPDALMQRAFQFKRQMIIPPAVSVMFAGVSIVFALQGFGAWAMVIGWYASTATGAVLSWWMARWRPFRGRFSYRIWREMAGFALPMFFDGLADRSREVFEQVIVGRVMGTATLGQYRYGYRLASLPSTTIITICSHVLFPAFSRIAEDGDRFRQAYVRALGWIWLAALPIAALLLIAGEPMVVLLLGHEWRAAGYASEAMAGIGLGTALLSVTAEAMKGAGRSSLLNWTSGLSVVLVVPLILLLLPFGLVGVGIAISLTYLVVGLVSVELARGVVGLSRREAWVCLAPATVSALAAFAVVMPLERYVIKSDQYAQIAGLAWVLGECALFIVGYLVALRLTSPTWFSALREAATSSVGKLGRLARRAG